MPRGAVNRDTRIYQKSQDIVSRKIVDEVILVPIRRRGEDVESLYTLNEVGARIWESIDGTRQVREIRDLIVAEFDVEGAQAEADLLTLLDQLSQIGAITEQGHRDG